MRPACIDTQRRSAQLQYNKRTIIWGFGIFQSGCAAKEHEPVCDSKQQLQGALQVYAGPLKGGSRAVVLFNRHSITTQYPISNVTVAWEQLGYPSEMKADVRDLHAEKTLGTFQGSFTAGVDIHDAVMVKITPQQVKQEYEEWRPWSQRNLAFPVSGDHPAESLLQQRNIDEE